MNKKAIISLIALLTLTILANAQMDNLANMSAKWIRSNVRNAALDGGADMVNYNPAGLAMLNEGIYLSLSNQMLFRHPQHSFNFYGTEMTYKQNGMDPILPMFYAAYKKNKYAVSSGVYISGGGATVDYPNGSLSTLLIANILSPNNQLTEQSLKASSYYLAIPLNFSYALSDDLSFSVGGRYIMGINNTEANVAFSQVVLGVDYKSTASGFGGIIGIDFRPSEKLNIAVHYETKVNLEFEVSDNKGSVELAENGTKSQRDLPAALNTGIRYKISDKLSTEADFNYYFQTAANWGDIVLADVYGNSTVKDLSDLAGNCYTANLGFIYMLNEKLEVSAGCSFTAFNYDNMELYYTQLGLYEAPKYDNLNIGLGAGYNISDNIQIDLGLGRTFWNDESIKSLGADIPVDVTNKSYVLALGVDFRL
ncbi:outer membrane protein transport protein [uncultured Draconibacterium sp.]|uniref:OmpP1/FadL family transporter n=1 Tax=uncultured Draconibacterium sp. TaxID=1573823 RepID=UPI0029C7210D|nr:outer membrane protein transport protein [uncultured Draconibacterium sp.]